MEVKHMQPENDDPYAVLGVTATATAAQISHAYRALLRALHPDTRRRAGAPLTEAADAELQRVVTAYAALRPAAPRPRPPPPAAPPPRPPAPPHHPPPPPPPPPPPHRRPPPPPAAPPHLPLPPPPPAPPPHATNPPPPPRRAAGGGPAQKNA